MLLDKLTHQGEGENVMIRSMLLMVTIGVCTCAHADQWRVSGHDIADTRSQPSEHRIDPRNVHSLTVKWTFTTGGNVSATPTVAGDTVFVPDSAGNLYAIDKDTGKLIWSHQISYYDGSPGAISRTSPAIDGRDIIVGDQEANFLSDNGTSIMAIDRRTAAVVFGDVVYVGVSSEEEVFALAPVFNAVYACCTFRGSVVALNAHTGKMLWKTYTIPDNGGKPGSYSGAAVWQQPAIDPVHHLLYVGTGNNYSAPQSVLDCQSRAIATGNSSANCAAPDDHFDSALALDLTDGHIVWAKRLLNYDVFTDACIYPGAGYLCPVPPGPDYDLGGSGPNLLPGFVGFGQKSGRYWALNPKNGAIRWSTQVGPGGSTGGIQWGTATDGRRIYVAIANKDAHPYALIPDGQEITWGAWSALDVRTGRLIWQTADPTTDGVDEGSVSVANGVVYAGSESGFMYALSAASGRILWSFNSGGSVIDGPSIVDGVVYWGSGYNDTNATSNDKLYAFSLQDRR
jgi:polyvinyl alcohol dehydrogenase (cytochrome)